MSLIRVEADGLLYDDRRSDCRCIHSRNDDGTYAFVQAIDTSTGEGRRYWGAFDAEHPEASIENILLHGGSWPDLSATESDENQSKPSSQTDQSFPWLTRAVCVCAVFGAFFGWLIIGPVLASL